MLRSAGGLALLYVIFLFQVQEQVSYSLNSIRGGRRELNGKIKHRSVNQPDLFYIFIIQGTLQESCNLQQAASRKTVRVVYVELALLSYLQRSLQ